MPLPDVKQLIFISLKDSIREHATALSDYQELQIIVVSSVKGPNSQTGLVGNLQGQHYPIHVRLVGP